MLRSRLFLPVPKAQTKFNLSSQHNLVNLVVPDIKIFKLQKPVLWIRNFCLDPDPELKFRIQQKVKEHINNTVNSGLFVLLDGSIE